MAFWIFILKILNSNVCPVWDYRNNPNQKRYGLHFFPESDGFLKINNNRFKPGFEFIANCIVKIRRTEKWLKTRNLLPVTGIMLHLT